jgi:hypothetical protein
VTIPENVVLTFFSRCINLGAIVNLPRARNMISFVFPARLDFAMTDPVFREAYEAVRKAHTGDAWSALTPRQIAEAIYQEIRRIDSNQASLDVPPKTPNVPA